MSTRTIPYLYVVQHARIRSIRLSGVTKHDLVELGDVFGTACLVIHAMTGGASVPRSLSVQSRWTCAS